MIRQLSTFFAMTIKLRSSALALSGIALIALLSTGCLVRVKLAPTPVPPTPTEIRPTPTLQPGYERHEFNPGRSIDLPSAWTALVADETLLSALETSATAIPDVVESAGGLDQIRDFMSSGARLWAVDPTYSTVQFAVSAMILEEKIGASISLENYGRLSIAQLEAANIEVSAVESLTIDGKEYRHVRSIIPVESIELTVQQFMWIENRSAWVFQITHLPQDTDYYRGVADRALASIQ